MPRDSNGIMTLPTSTWVQTGDTVLPVQHNPPFRDIESALTNSLDRDGRTVMTGNLQMGGNKVTGLGDPSLPGDAMTRRVSGIEFETRALAEAWPGVDPMPESIVIRGDASVDDGLGGTFALGHPSSDTIVVAGVSYGRVEDVSEARIEASLLSRLRGLLSPMDFGAVGDGIADDSAAVNEAMVASVGSPLNGLGRIYKIPSPDPTLQMVNGLVRVSGSYQSEGSPREYTADMSYHPVMGIGSTGIALNEANADYVNSWIATLENPENSHAGGLAWEVRDQRWWALLEKDGEGYLAVYSRWYGDLADAGSYPLSDEIGHQGFALEDFTGPTFAWTSRRYHSVNHPIAGRQVIRFVPNDLGGTKRIYTLFGPEFAYVQGTCMPAISPDGKFLVASARKDSRDFWVRVFDLAALIEGGEGDYSDSYITQWAVNPDMLADGANGLLSPCQNIATDGASVFFVCGDSAPQNKTIAQYDIYGRHIFTTRSAKLGMSWQSGTTHEPQALAICRDTMGAMRLHALVINGTSAAKENRVIRLGVQTTGLMLEPANSLTMGFALRGSDGVLRRSTLTFS